MIRQKERFPDEKPAQRTPKVNYMSTLSFDRHPAVRRFWFETLAYWMIRCVDKAWLQLSGLEKQKRIAGLNPSD